MKASSTSRRPCFAKRPTESSIEVSTWRRSSSGSRRFPLVARCAQLGAEQIDHLQQGLAENVRIRIGRIFQGVQNRGNQVVFPEPDHRNAAVQAHLAVAVEHRLRSAGVIRV